MCAPDPTPARDTAAAQNSASLSSAITNSFLGNVNEITPDGTKTFSQIGSESVYDPYTGRTYDVPRFQVEQELSDQQEAIKGESDAARLNLAGLGADISGGLRDQLSEPFTLGNEEVEGRLFDLGMERLRPEFDRRGEDLRTRLANQGIKEGSTAYDRAIEREGRQENDAINQLLLTGRGQAVGEQLTEDNQRLNQVLALLRGGSVAQPQFLSGVQSAGVATPDVAGAIAANDASRMQAFGYNQGLLGQGLSTAGTLLALSDERAKTDKKKVGETKDGMGLYSFKYKGSPRTEVGLMAQEVKKKHPEAVRMGRGGLMHVDYEKALS